MANPRKKSFYEMFKSGLEGLTSDYLRTREKKFGYKTTYETEWLNYTIEGRYKPDFILTFNSGHKRYIETKGYLDYEAQRKMVAVRKANPDLDIRILFSKDNIIRKGAKTKYSDWAKKIGYPYAIKDIPIEWLTDPLKEERAS